MPIVALILKGIMQATEKTNVIDQKTATLKKMLMGNVRRLCMRRNKRVRRCD